MNFSNHLFVSHRLWCDIPNIQPSKKQIKQPNRRKCLVTISFSLQKSEQPGNKKTVATDEGVRQTIHNGHDAMSAVMSARSKNLQIVRAMWTSGNTKV